MKGDCIDKYFIYLSYKNLMENKILVFIPMYNCEKQIERVID